MSLDQLRLIPQDGLTLQALAQQVLCWARRDGVPDTRVKIGTGWNSHIVVPPGVCAEHGAPPFTSKGQSITCPAPGEGQVTYYIFPTDVLGLNITDCTPLDQLAAPTGVAATPGPLNATITWGAVADAAGYAVQYRVQDAADWTAGPTVAAGVLTATVDGLTGVDTYEFQVMATATPPMKDSSWSATVTADPLEVLSIPTDFAVAAGDAQVTATWAANLNTDSFEIEYWTGTAQRQTKAVTGELTTVIDGLTNGTAYQFRIRAVPSTAGWAASEWSETQTATPVAGGL